MTDVIGFLVVNRNMLKTVSEAIPEIFNNYQRSMNVLVNESQERIYVIKTQYQQQVEIDLPSNYDGEKLTKIMQSRDSSYVKICRDVDVFLDRSMKKAKQKMIEVHKRGQKLLYKVSAFCEELRNCIYDCVGRYTNNPLTLADCLRRTVKPYRKRYEKLQTEVSNTLDNLQDEVYKIIMSYSKDVHKAEKNYKKKTDENIKRYLEVLKNCMGDDKKEE